MNVYRKRTGTAIAAIKYDHSTRPRWGRCTNCCGKAGCRSIVFSGRCSRRRVCRGRGCSVHGGSRVCPGQVLLEQTVGSALNLTVSQSSTYLLPRLTLDKKGFLPITSPLYVSSYFEDLVVLEFANPRITDRLSVRLDPKPGLVRRRLLQDPYTYVGLAIANVKKQSERKRRCSAISTTKSISGSSFRESKTYVYRARSLKSRSDGSRWSDRDRNGE